MMNKVLIGLIGAAGTMLIASCADTFNPGGDSDRQGRLFPSVNLDKSVVTSKSTPKAPASRAAEAVSADQMKIRLVRDAGGYEKTWDSLADFPTDELFPVGEYTFSAFYGSEEEQGFNKPYYYGECSVTVEENKAAQVQLTAQLANSMLTIAYSEAFAAYFTDYTTTLTTALGALEYAADATEPVYLPAGEVQFAIAVTKPSGTKATLTPSPITLLPRHHYTVKFDVNNGNVETPVLEITWDEMLDQEVVEIDLSDDIINAPKPTIASEGFPVESFIAGNAPAGARSVTVVAHGGISSIVMTTSSPSLREQGWPAEMDLLAGDAAANAATAALGLATRGLSKPGKMAQVILTGVLNNINYVEGRNNTTEFTFVARDKYNKESEPLTVSVDIEKLILELSNPAAIVKGQTDFSFNLAYNGGDPEKAVTIQQSNTRGTWDNIPATFTAVSRTVGNYLVEVTVDGEKDVKLRAVAADGTVSNEMDVTHAESLHALSINDRNSFAHSTKVTLIDNPNYAGAVAVASRRIRKSAADMAAKAQLQVSTDGKTFSNAANATLNGTTWTVSGLDANTTYYFRAIVDGIACATQTAKTEAELSFENNSFETWSRTDGQTQYWWISFPDGSNGGGQWSTLNQLTTSEGGGSTNWINRNGCAYSAISGTIETDDAKVGSKAALIRSCGWGGGNSAAVSSGMGTCENVTAGELYLGHYDTSSKSPVYGMDFTSRPASISFWYKYAKKADEDYGYFEVTLYDAAGNAIQKQTRNLTATEYTRETITFSYPDLCAKAARCSVIFRSSGHTDLNSKKNTTWLTPPPARNTSDGTYMGSQLYVDDVELSY